MSSKTFFPCLIHTKHYNAPINQPNLYKDFSFLAEQGFFFLLSQSVLINVVLCLKVGTFFSDIRIELFDLVYH